MHSKTLALLCLSASALAAAELEKKQYGDSDDYYNSLMSDLNSLASETDYYNYLTYDSDLDDIYKDLPTDYLDYTNYLSDLPSATNLGYLGDSSSSSDGDSSGSGSGSTRTRSSSDSETTAGSFDTPTMTSGPELTGLGKAPPASIQSVLITAIPESYLSQLSNPSARSSMFSEIADGHYPQWYEDLPSSVKSWVSENYAPSGGPHGNSASVPGTGVIASGVVAAAGVFALAVLL